MEELDLLAEIVSTLVKGLKIPVTCKTRIYKDFDRTIRLCETLVGAGASMLTIHGRTREEKGQLVRAADWAMLARIKKHFAGRVPIVSNGGISSMEDLQRCLAETGVDGVMSSEAVLENPALFQRTIPQIDLAEQYLDFCRQYPVHPIKCVRSHLIKMLHRYTVKHTELREMYGTAHTLDEFADVCKICRELISVNGEESYTESWYYRYNSSRYSDEVKSVPLNIVLDKDMLVNKKTSFLTSTNNESTADDLWGTVEGDDNEEYCGIFHSLNFAT